jgi:hypothetical protein
MIALLLALADGPADFAARAAAMTSAAQQCPRVVSTTDVTVCGLRSADRYRVPFVGPDPGDPRRQSVAAERDKLLARTTPIDEMSPFLVNGGMAGVTVGTGRTGGLDTRKIAP